MMLNSTKTVGLAGKKESELDGRIMPFGDHHDFEDKGGKLRLICLEDNLDHILEEIEGKRNGKLSSYAA